MVSRVDYVSWDSDGDVVLGQSYFGITHKEEFSNYMPGKRWGGESEEGRQGEGEGDYSIPGALLNPSIMGCMSELEGLNFHPLHGMS